MANNNLFSQDDDFVSMDEEEIEFDDVDQAENSEDEDEVEDEDSEGGLGGKNIFFIGFILILAVAVIAFMIITMQDSDSEKAVSSDDPAASESVSFTESTDSSIAENSKEESAPDIQVSVDESKPNEPSFDTTSEESGDTSDPPEEELFHGWIINNMGYTYLYYGVGVEQFNHSNKTLQMYTDSLAALAAKIPQGTNLYCMPVPTRIGFLNGQISSEIKNQDNFFNSSQESFIDSVSSALGDTVKVVDLFSSFSEKYDSGEYLYFNTDLNWTSDAAHLAYKEFCAQSGNAAIILEAYEAHELSGFLGSFYRATYSEDLEKNADTFRYYKNVDTDACKVTVYRNGSTSKKYNLLNNDLTSTSKAYSLYLGTTAPRFKLESPCASGKKLLIVGDGSAAAMLPFLISNYSEIHYIDVALYDEDFSAFLAENQFNDVLFMTYATNAVKGEYPAHLEAMAGVQADE